MILNVYCYYNKLLEAFGNYQLDDHEPQKIVVGLTRDLRAQFLQGKIENLRYLDLYLLGTFNDETGEFVNKKQLILDLGVTISQFEAQKKSEKEAEDNGK